MIENNTLGQEQQLVYHINCDKHTTVGGAPPILVLQKDSIQPPILILSGTQTYPLRTPVIKDERQNKGQGYILQDERKPPPPNHPATLPYLSTGRGEIGYSYQHPISASVPNDPQQQQQYTHLPIDPSSQDHSYSGQQGPNPDINYNWSFGGTPQSPYNNTLLSGDGMIPSGGSYGKMNHSSQGGYDPYYRQQPQLTAGSSPWVAKSTPSFNNYMSTGDRMMVFGRGGPMTPNVATPTMSYPPPAWSSYNTNNTNGNGMVTDQQHQQQLPRQRHNTITWNNRNIYDHPHQQPLSAPYLQHSINPAFSSAVQQPTVIHGARRSKSVSFAPLPNFVAT